jgi:hypothetical protein
MGAPIPCKSMHGCALAWLGGKGIDHSLRLPVPGRTLQQLLALPYRVFRQLVVDLLG